MNARLRKFLSYYRPHMKIFALDMGCVLLVAGVSLALPMVSRYIIKQLTGGAPADALPQILWAGGGMLALILLYTACNMAYGYQGHLMGAKWKQRCGRSCSRTMSGCPFRSMTSRRSGG